MYISRKKLSLDKIRMMSLVTNIVLIIFFIILLFTFWNIQIIKNHHFKSLAIRNISRKIRIKAPRGIIQDKKNRILAENKLDFNLFLLKENIKNEEKTIANAAFITGLKPDLITEKVKKYMKSRGIFRIPIKRNLPLEKVVYIESRADEFSEFKIEVEPARTYPYKNIASHLLGYVSEITPEELNEYKKKEYKIGNDIGKSGIEKQYENFIKGEAGSHIEIKDNLGRVHEVLEKKNPIIGDSIVLTIDIELQKYIEEIFNIYKGTIEVVDLSNGDILALVSKPNFNPEKFSVLMEKKDWEILKKDPDKPLHNKSIQGLYSPGSVFKIVMALTALQEEIVEPSKAVFCGGAENIYNRIFHCWKSSGHGWMNLSDALKNSCNIYFYQLGKKIDIDIIAKYAKWLGLGEKTQIDLPNEKRGLVPTKEWKKEHMKNKWLLGETISISIGGGFLNVTPTQVLTMISTVALRGKMPQIHLLKMIKKQGEIIKEFQPKFKKVPIEEKYFDIVIKGLFNSVNDGGTGRAAMVKGMDICGKTGTQQIISKENPAYTRLVKQKRFRPHSWFVSFAPRDNPKIAIVVFVENGGDAGQIAAPIAAKIYRKLLLK